MLWFCNRRRILIAVRQISDTSGPVSEVDTARERALIWKQGPFVSLFKADTRLTSSQMFALFL